MTIARRLRSTQITWASSLLFALSDSRQTGLQGYVFPCGPWSTTPSLTGLPSSQSFFHGTPSALTPMDQTAAYADFFTVHAGFTQSERLTIHKGITKLISVHAFALRLTISLSDIYMSLLLHEAGLAPRALLPPHDRPQLPVQSAINRASSFQLARMTELGSAHQIFTD